MSLKVDRDVPKRTKWTDRTVLRQLRARDHALDSQSRKLSDLPAPARPHYHPERGALLV